MKNGYALIFAKFPQSGLVKTRMVPPLTDDQAAKLHRLCLQSVCERVSANNNTKPILVFTPDHQLESFQNIVSDHVDDYWPQGGGDLGERLIRAINHAFSQNADHVILLGADSPTLPIEILTQTIEKLTHHDAVIGPCDDGGYYLLAMNKPQPELFRDIDWGSDKVADQTKARAAHTTIDLFELASWYDIDRYDDLVRAQSDLKDASQDQWPVTYRLKSFIDELIVRVEK